MRERAANALAEVGKDAVPILTAALSDPNGHVRGLAVRALEKIGPSAKAAVPCLKALKDKDFSVSGPAAAVLGAIGPEVANEAVPALAKRSRRYWVARRPRRHWDTWGRRRCRYF